MKFSLQLMQLDNDDFKSLKMDDISPEIKSIMMSLQGKHEDFLMQREHNLNGITEEDIINETDEFIESFGVLELTYDDIERYVDKNIDFGPFDDKKPINEESFNYYLNKMCLKTDGLVIYKGDTSNALDWSMLFGKYLNQLQPEYLDENFNEISREDFVRKSLKIKQEFGYSLSSLICYINDIKKTIKTYYDNGNIKEEFEVNTKGNRHGITRMYHDNGQLKVSMTHKNGKQTPGVVISYHNNGVKAREVTLAVNGNLNGDFKEWHNNGSIRHEGYYKEDKCFIHKEYDKDGLLIDFKSMRHNNDTLRIAVKEWLDDAVFAEAKYGHISDWDTSEVTDMSKLFLDAYTFNENINNWDVSNVTDMRGMFGLAESFNQPLDNWDVSNVTDMSHLFASASAFNQPLDNWDVSNVTDMRYMFNKASAFNQSLNKWNVSSVTDMTSMFFEATSFNQPLDNWDVSNVKKMNQMFLSMLGSLAFNQPLDKWDVSNVTDMSLIFGNGHDEMIEKYGVDGEKLRSFNNKKNNETGDIKDYGITRRVDIYEDNEGDEYYLIVYLLIRLYDDQDELEGYELEGDIIEDIFEFTVAIKNNSIVKEGLSLEFIEPYGEDTCTFEDMEDFFERDVKEYGTDLKTLINIGEIKSEILKKYTTEN